MFAAEEIVQHLEKGNPMAEAVMEAFDSLFGPKPLTESMGFRVGGTPVPRGINRKPKNFCRTRKPRVTPIEFPTYTLEEWLSSQCGLPSADVEDYLRANPCDETIRLAREGDYAAKYELANAIGKEYGIPEYEDADGLNGTIMAARRASGHPVDEATGVSGKPLVEHVEYRKGHKDSKGEDAPWVIVSCQTGKILSSHKTKEKAEEHLGQMKYYKHKK